MLGKADYGKRAFHLLGGLAGVRVLANCFYDIMGEIPEARKIRDMHPANLEQTRENLSIFLSGWLGGPPLYREKYGAVNLTEVHAHLEIDAADRDMWLFCMEQALNKQVIADDFRTYLLKRFQVPAEKIRTACQERHQGLPSFISSTPKK